MAAWPACIFLHAAADCYRESKRDGLPLAWAARVRTDVPSGGRASQDVAEKRQGGPKLRLKERPSTTASGGL